VIIEKTIYTVLETGVYPATVESIEETSGQFGPQLKVKFDLGGDNHISAWASQALGEKSKLGKWTRAILGNIPETLDTASLIGKPCRLSVTVKTRDDGTEYNRVDEVLAPKAATPKGPKPQPQPEPVAEGQELPF
jgi:hypothetical protein